MNIGVLLPGFSANADDWAIPVQQDLMRELAKADDVRIVALRYPHQRQAYSLNGAWVYPLGAGQVRGIGRLRLWWRALRLIERLHRERPFDVLHAMWADETGLIAARAGRRLGVPVVVSILGGELVGLRDIDYGLQLSGFSHWVVGQALSEADRVVVPSESVRRMIAQAGYMVPNEKIDYLPLGVDTDLFKPSETAGDPFRLISVASLVPVKDQATLLRAVARLDQRFTVDLVGDGSERGSLEELARTLGIADRVRFVGAVKHPELSAYYQRAAAMVLSSRHEILPIAALEAAACSVPVVSSAVGALVDLPEIAITVPVGDDASLADVVNSLVKDEESLQARGMDARAAVEWGFRIEGVADGLRGVYARLRRPHPPTPSPLRGEGETSSS